MHPRMFVQALTLTVAIGLATATCRDAEPVAPAGPSPTPVARVDVGVLGGAPARVALQQTLQLWAVAVEPSGASSDVTNAAKWSSSNSAVATVGVDGRISAVSEGVATITAQYQSVPGRLDLQVIVAPCAGSTVTPRALVFSAYGWQACSDTAGQYGQRLEVQTTQQTCSWTATVDAPWLSIECGLRLASYTPRTSGNGNVHYLAGPNNSPSPRTGHITITFSDGTSVAHTVTEEAAACSYVVNPPTSHAPYSGGGGGFDLIVTGNDCRWSLTTSVVDPRSFADAIRTSPARGTGSQHIEYLVTLPSADRIFNVEVRGSEGIIWTTHQVVQGR